MVGLKVVLRLETSLEGDELASVVERLRGARIESVEVLKSSQKGTEKASKGDVKRGRTINKTLNIIKTSKGDIEEHKKGYRLTWCGATVSKKKISLIVGYISVRKKVKNESICEALGISDGGLRYALTVLVALDKVVLSRGVTEYVVGASDVDSPGEGQHKKFANHNEKKRVIYGCATDGETLTRDQLADRVRGLGYDVDAKGMGMYIYHHMLHQYFTRENIKGVNYYTKIPGAMEKGARGSSKKKKKGEDPIPVEDEGKPSEAPRFGEKRGSISRQEIYTKPGYVHVDREGNVECPEQGFKKVPFDGNCENKDGIPGRICGSFFFKKGKDVRCNAAD